MINKENTYQMIIKEKSDAIRKLEKQLADVIQSQSSSNKSDSLKSMRDRLLFL